MAKLLRCMGVALVILAGGSAAAQDAPLAPRPSPLLFRGSSPNFAEQVRSGIRPIYRCFEAQHRRGRDAPPGRLRFTIERSGRTSKIRFIPVSQRTADPRFTTCLIGVVRRMRFARQESPVTVMYPLFVDVAN